MEKYTLENTEFSPRYIFFKFGLKSRLKDLQESGQMYLKNLNYYVEEEKKALIKGKGDINEGVTFKATNVRIFLPGTNIQIGSAKGAIVRETNILQCPVYCMTYKNMMEDVFEFNYPDFRAKINIDKRLGDNFEDYVLIIDNAGEFMKRMRVKLKQIGVEFYHGKVNSVNHRLR